MSKQRRERANQSEHIELGLTASTAERLRSDKADALNHPTGADESTESNKPNKSTESRKAGLLAYIRNPSHWWVIGLIALLSLGAMGAGLKYLEDSAHKQKTNNLLGSDGQNNGSFLSKLNPFVPTSTPLPTPALSKEHIYAGSRMLAVVDNGADAEPPADLAYWRPSTGTWYVMGGTGSTAVTVTWGTNGETPVPGDYDGDGKTDFAVFSPSGNWTIQKSSDSAQVAYNFGVANDKAAAADYDGDGKTDAAVFRPGNGTWYLSRSSAGYIELQFAAAGDIPVPADYDGDGKADIAVFRPSTGWWYMQRSTLGYGEQQFGLNGDAPVPADYDGDGRADFAVRRGNDWYIKQSSSDPSAQPQIITWQLGSDTAVPNDYDGDGKVDIAVWRSASRGTWYIKNSSNNETRTVQWGKTGDIPVPAFYRR